MPTRPLVLADYRADRLYTVDGSRATSLDRGVLAEHAGVLELPSRDADPHRWAYLDDRRGDLVVHGGPEPVRISVAIPGEHLACDATGRHVVATTGLGANHAPWSDVVTVADLDRGESVRFRTRTGEPGVLVVPDQSTGDPVIVLRHREPGAIEAIPLADALAVGAHVPVLSGEVCTDIADDGHGDVVDQQRGIVATATSRGLERFVVDRGVPRALGVVPWPVAGRAFYLRFAPLSGSAVGVVRGGPAAPDAWAGWTNHLVDVELESGRRRHLELPGGLGFRFALGGGSAVAATVHPDGDRLTVVRRDTDELEVAHQVDLPAMSRPPVPGRLPWDPVGDAPAQRRAVALDPTGTVAAVTRGGDGELHLVSDGGVETVTVPTPLDEGGVLFWPGGPVDAVGR